MKIIIALVTLTAACVLGLGVSAKASEIVPPDSGSLYYSFSPIVKKTAPAVVNIYTKRVVQQRVSPFMADPLFEQFFGNMGLRGLTREQVESSLGSGVIIEPEGIIVTNAHVVKGAQEIVVALGDRREFDATISLIDEKSDLAILRVDTHGEKLPHALLKPSETLEVGDIVLAIGNPFGVGQTVTSGIVSALARSTLNINDFNFFIQTDAAINPGNSGGPLVDMNGNIVGINTAIYSRSGGSLGIGFAVPSEMVASVIAAEKSGAKGGVVTRAWLGINGQQVTADIAESLGLDRPRGVLVSHLHPASPLSKEGMKVGDVVAKINGRDINDAAELKFRLATVPLGGDVTLEVLRQGKPQSFTVKALAPPDNPPRREAVLKGLHPLDGVRVSNINPAVAVELNLDVEGGVVVVDSGMSRLARRGDLIIAVNDVEADTVKTLERALDAAAQRGVFALVLERDGHRTQIVIR
jgi:serine protease Do